MGSTEGSVSKLKAYFPFIFNNSIDPTSIFTVGDQVVSEHIFAFAARRSLKEGFISHAADVVVNQLAHEVSVCLNQKLFSADGRPFEFDDLERSIKKSISGTTHAPYSSIVKNVITDQRNKCIRVEYTKLPVNLRFLFTLPDFSLFFTSEIPSIEKNASSATGPFSIASFSKERIELKRNPFFPEELVANKFENAELISYSASDSIALINKLNPAEDTAAYFYGYSLNRKDLTALENRGYQVEISPNEWLIYLKVDPKISAEIKDSLYSLVELFKSTELSETLGNPAYSVAPIDRPYLVETLPEKPLLTNALKGLKIRTLSTWAMTPVFKAFIDFLKSKAPVIQVELLHPSEIRNLFNSDSQIALCPLGLSPVDELSHLSFLSETVGGFNSVIRKSEIADAAMITDEKDFISTVRLFEQKIRDTKIIVPIGHFPGVIATSKKFTVEKDIAFDWGIQLWSIRSN